MIVLERLRWKNFLSTGNQFTELDLGGSATNARTSIVTGPNGAGKSTMIEALSYVLFNKAVRGVTKPELVNNTTRRELLVEVEFSTPSHSYVVRRGEKPAVFEIYRDGELLPQSDRNSDQRLLENNVLFTTHAAFMRETVLSKTNYAPFMRLSPRDKRTAIENLLGLNVFSDMNKILAEEIKQHKVRQSEVNVSIAVEDAKITAEERSVAMLEGDNDEAITQLDTDIRAHESDIEKLAAEYAKKLGEQKKLGNDSVIRRELSEHRSKETQASLLKEKAQADIVKFSSMEECPTCEQVMTAEHRDKHLGRLRDETWAQARVLLSAAALREQAEQKLADHEREAREISTRLIQIQAEAAAKKSALDGLNAKRDVLNDRSKHIAHLVSLLEKSREEKRKLEDEKRDLDVCDKVLQAASHLLSEEGVKNIIVSQYIPSFNKMVAKYLGYFKFFGEIRIDSSFDVAIRYRYCEDRSYESLSEGERQRIDAALLFAMRAVARERYSAGFNALFFDEVLDSSMDSDGADAFLQILTDELPNGEAAFVISHRGDQLVDKFQRAISFDKNGIFSRMEVH